MSELGEDFKFLREQTRLRHQQWHKDNRAVIDASGTPYSDRGETLLFRGAVKADFYPSTGRWRSGGKTYRGGAQSFLNWLKKEHEKNDARND
jgi:hypothetical protein